MKSVQTTIALLLLRLQKELQASRILNFTLSLLLIFTAVACSKDDPAPPVVEIEQMEDPQEDPQEEDPKEEETPPSDTQLDIEAVDTAISAFLAKYNVPGAAVAVSVDEKMVYTKGYGFANVDTQTATKPDDVFRVASLSKPFTSTAIMTLVDQGKLQLSDKVFGPEGILGESFGTAVLSANELEITVDHLLIHGSGGWGTQSGDPIDREPQLNADQFIEYILNNWDLPNAPGTNFEYSNTGYWLLARIIEKVSGQSYEAYLKDMAAGAGITSIKTTTFREDNRAPNEVEYYGTAQDMQWIYTIASRRDGDGGVVISAPDMLRFMCAVDGRSKRTDLVSSEAQKLMSEPSEISGLGRGLGTWEAQDLLFFTGSLPGTRTWFYMNKNGVSAVVLLNYRRTDIAEFDNDLNTLVYNLVKDTSLPWQTGLDQF